MSGSVYTDFGQRASLRADAQSNPNAALEEVAAQFEGLFVQMMMKSMRDATLKSDLLQSDALDSYQQMADKQMSLHLSESGGMGLARFIVEQMQAQQPAGATPLQTSVGATAYPIQGAAEPKVLPFSVANTLNVDEEA